MMQKEDLIVYPVAAQTDEDNAWNEMPVQSFEYPFPTCQLGINVFEYSGNGSYYVGSFDGLFLWNTLTGEVNNLLNFKNQ